MDKEKKYVWVEDKTGNVYVCKLSDLIDPENLSEEEKENCLDTADFDLAGMP